MKRILNLHSLCLALLASMIFFSCSDDPIDPIDVKPIVTLNSVSEITLEPTETFTIEFSASKGDDSPLKAITVFEDGVKVPTSRLTYNGEPAAANPALLFDDDVNGLTWTIDIVSHSLASSTVTYKVEVQDEASQTSSVLVNVTTVGTSPDLTTTTPMTIETSQDIKNLFRLSASKGTGDLVSIGIKENGQVVDPSKIFWQTISMSVENNPFDLREDEKGGFDNGELYIMTPEAEGTFTYTITLTDEFGLTDELSFEVTTLPSGTAVDLREDVLFNADGPGAAGGLDLDTGMSTFPSAPEAELIDNGIDTDQPLDKNWLQSISPNSSMGVSMRYLRAGENGLSENFNFEDGVRFKEDLAALYDNGVDIENNATEPVEVGDMFIVTREGNYWVLITTAINIAPTDNTDSYMFDVKY